MADFTKSTLNYPQGADTAIRRVAYPRAPTTTDYRNFIPGDEWLDTSSDDWWKFVSRSGNPTVALWVKIGGTSAAAETFTGNSGGAVSPDAANNINLLGTGTTTVVGNPGTNTLTITPSAAGYPITPYVVGPAGQAGYQTIQSAIDAANAAGGGTVWIQPGTYVENLTLYEEVDLIAYRGGVGNPGTISVPPPIVESVIIQGNLTLDSSAPPGHSSYNTITNIDFVSNSGDIITFITDSNSMSELTFEGCDFELNDATASCFAVAGFPGLNLINCQVLGSGDLCSFPGGNDFLNLFAKNSFFDINDVSPFVIPANSDIHFILSNCYYSAMIDASSAGTFFDFLADSTTITWTGTGTAPLIDFGAQSGAVYLNNCYIIDGSGPISNSTSVSAASYFKINNCYFGSTLVLSGACKENFWRCTFDAPAGEAIIMNSSENVSLFGCIINSSNNPAISGAGTGTLTYSDLVFSDNANFAGTLTLAKATWKPFSVDSAVPTPTDNGTCHFDSAAFQVDADGFVQLVGGGTAVEEFLPDTGTSPVVPNASGQVSVLGQATPNTSGIQVTGGTNSLNIAMFSPFAGGNFGFVTTSVSGTNTVFVENPDNTMGDSNAAFSAISGGTSSGDPYNHWVIPATRFYSLGIDNSDSDNFKLTTDVSPVSPSTGTNLIRVTSSGATSVLAGNLDVTRSNTAGTVSATVSNTDNTAASASSAAFVASVGGTTQTGDAFNQWAVGSSRSYAMGPDTSDSQILKLTTDAAATVTPSGSSVLMSLDPNFPAGPGGNYVFAEFTSIDTNNNISIFNITSPNDGPLELQINNAGTTAGSDSYLDIRCTGGAGAGSPYIDWVNNIAPSDIYLGLPPASTTLTVSINGIPGTGTTLFQIQRTGDTSVLVGDFDVTRADVAGTVLATVSNTDNTAASASSAAVIASVGGTTQTGDPYMQWSIGSARSYALGPDTSNGGANSVLTLTTDTAASVTPSSGTIVFEHDPTADAGALPSTPASYFNVAQAGISRDAAGQELRLACINEDDANTASHAVVEARVLGGPGLTAGDAFMRCVGNLDWVFGEDATTPSEPVFKLGHGGSPSGFSATYMTVQGGTSEGTFNYPLQPAFLATHTVAQDDSTGAGTTVTVNFTTEIFDQNSDYDGTNTFTAPVTGRYLLRASVYIANATGSTSGEFTISTSNRGYRLQLTSGAGMVSDQYVLEGCTFADMDATDTAIVRVTVSGMGGDTADLSAVPDTTNFSGYLAV